MTKFYHVTSVRRVLSAIALMMLCGSLAAATMRGKKLDLPSGEVLLNVDFEEATVTPPRNRKQNNKMDVLGIKLPTGQPVEATIFYEDGNPSGRFAKIIPDPTKSGNHVLQYWMKEAQVPGERKGRYKGRIQMNLADFEWTEAYQRYRMYLHPDLKLYRSYPGESGWFTVNELWFGASWKGHSNPFRITLGIGKESGAGKPLFFLATGEVKEKGKWKPVWHSVNEKLAVPIGEWIDMEVGYKQGDKNTGRFRVAIKRAGDAAMTPIIDVHDWTYHPRSKQPVPMTQWNPLKLYTSSSVIDFIRDQGGVAQIYYDDLTILKKWPN